MSNFLMFRKWDQIFWDFGRGKSPLNCRSSGKSLLIFGNIVKSQNKKYFALPEIKSAAHYAHPVPLRGALAIVTTRGGDAVDVTVALDGRG